MTKPNVIIFIGVPGSGKTTLIEKARQENKWLDYVVLSTDKFILDKAKELGKTYNDIFQKYKKTAWKNFHFAVRDCIDDNKSIIIDRINMTKVQRQKVLELIPSHYHKTAIIVNVELEEAIKRVKKRNTEGGIYLNAGFIKGFLDSFEAPTNEEFDDIITINN